MDPFFSTLDNNLFAFMLDTFFTLLAVGAGILISIGYLSGKRFELASGIGLLLFALIMTALIWAAQS